MLTLSEQALLRRHGYNIEVEEIRRAWEDEKDSLLAAINSLKELLAETHKGRDASKVRVLYIFTFLHIIPFKFVYASIVRHFFRNKK